MNNKTSTIFLLGMPGCGKSHLGEKAAEKMQRSFIDFDHFIERKEGKTITQIFEESGEAGFRVLENKYLKGLIENGTNRIIALGGGTPCFSDNIDLIKSNGLSIYLRVPVPDLLKRLLPVMHIRPLLKGKNESELKIYLENLLVKREHFYKQADILIDVAHADAIAFVHWLIQQVEI